MQAGVLPGANNSPAALSDPGDLRAPEAESSALGFMMQCEPREVLRLADELASWDFTDARHQLIFQAVEALATPGTVPSLTAVQVELGQSGNLERAGGAEYLGYLLGVAALDLEDALTSASQLRVASARRQLDLAGNQIKALAVRTGLDIEECQQQAQQILAEAVQRDTLDIAISAEELQARASDRLQQWRQGIFPETIPTGLPDLDFSLSIQRGDFGVICGDTGVGKTAFAFQICSHAANIGHPVFIGEFEMSDSQCSDRLISQQVGISPKLMKGRKFVGGVRQMPTDWHFDRWQEGIDWLGGLPLKVVCKGGMAVDTIASMMRMFQLEQELLGNERCPILLIDYLQLMEGAESNNRARDVAKQSRALKKLAMRLDIAVIALSQLSRTSDSQKDKRPTRGRLKESSAIEQDANWILGLYVPEPEEGGDEAPTIIDDYEVIKLKDREGSQGKITLIWYPETTRFVSVYGTQQQAQLTAEATATEAPAPIPNDQQEAQQVQQTTPVATPVFSGGLDDAPELQAGVSGASLTESPMVVDDDIDPDDFDMDLDD